MNEGGGGGGLRARGAQARLLYRTFQGDPAAARELISEALGIYQERLLELRDELDYHRANSWDEEAAREVAFGEEAATPEQVLGAFSEIHTKVLFLCAALPVVLMSNEEEASVFEPAIRGAAFDLFLLLHTPEIRYAIVGGFRPELREDVDDYLDRMGLAVWGTIDAILSEDDLDAEDFPPETRQIMEHMANVAQQRQQ